jgi:hypothetical protein
MAAIKTIPRNRKILKDSEIAVIAPAANKRESHGRKGITTNPVSTNTIQKRMIYVSNPYSVTKKSKCWSI